MARQFWPRKLRRRLAFQSSVWTVRERTKATPCTLARADRVKIEMSRYHTGSLPPSSAEGAEINLHSLNPWLACRMLGPAGLPDPRGGR
eukprot:4051623-Pyramimonas_sp.AAC.1